MTDQHDAKHYAQNPQLLFDLCRAVAQRIEEQSPYSETTELEAQLREVARAIDRLEATKIQVPDALRAEKARLVLELDKASHSQNDLKQFADGLAKVAREIMPRSGQKTYQPLDHDQYADRNPFRTSPLRLREQLIESLKSLGGRAESGAVYQDIAQKMSSEFKPDDLVMLMDKSGRKIYSWQVAARKQRSQLVKDGTLRSDSPRGIWELSDDHGH